VLVVVAGTACGSSATTATTPEPTLTKAVGQLLIATYKGTTPPPSILSAVRAGRIGSIILMGGNTGNSVAVTRLATSALQKAARAGGNPGLLIMTDQEGGEVKRLPGPPAYSASQMGDPSVAAAQGYATALMLRKAGVNVDLAPVVDVTQVDGFMTTEQRTFGSNPPVVARAACAFARGLVKGGVAYTLKHFPGLGDAVKSTDVEPVAIDEPAAEIEADDAAYRSCGSGRLALVMVSSASYTNLTGDLPAVMTPSIYNKVMVNDGIGALTVSDALDSGAIKPWPSAARRSIAAGLDMAMYPNREADALKTYTTLLADVRAGRLDPGRVRAAAMRVLALKRALGLG
jgi:beta-N-acetylhexosaminidase